MIVFWWLGEFGVDNGGGGWVCVCVCVGLEDLERSGYYYLIFTSDLPRPRTNVRELSLCSDWKKTGNYKEEKQDPFLIYFFLFSFFFLIINKKRLIKKNHSTV